MTYKLLNLLFFLIFSPSCFYLKKQTEAPVGSKDKQAFEILEKSLTPNYSIKFKGEQVFEPNKTYKGFKVGGLSELFFDESSGYFFALSDDKKNHRFYKLALTTKPVYKFQIEEQILLKSPGHERLRINMDPEALAMYGDNTLFIASEGQQIFKVHEPTQIFTFDKQGVLKEAWPVPPVFWKTGQTKQDPLFGQQENNGFESLSLDKASNTLWTATEKPLKQDFIFKNKFFVRLSVFNIKNKQMLAQYPYALKNRNSGLTSLQLLKPKIFISLERTYKQQEDKYEMDIFLTDCRQASNVLSQMKLQRRFKACFKKELWNSSKNSPVEVDNLESLVLAPVPFSQKQLMVLASDNDFNKGGGRKTQFLFFELIRNE